jgi:hypothetical protein
MILSILFLTQAQEPQKRTDLNCESRVLVRTQSTLLLLKVAGSGMLCQKKCVQIQTSTLSNVLSKPCI